MYANINNFIENTGIRYDTRRNDGASALDIQRTGYYPSVHCYSLSRIQKTILISTIVLAIITFTIGLILLWGGFVGSGIGEAMIVIGVVVAVSLIIGIMVNHLVFVKKIGEYLRTQHNQEEWISNINYPRLWGGGSRAARFAHPIDGEIIRGERYAHFVRVLCWGLAVEYAIEFHRTEQIHNERNSR